MTFASNPLVVVYVLLGKNPAPTLYAFAHYNSVRFKNSQNVLITDSTNDHRKFPGVVISPPQTQNLPGFKKFLRKNKAYNNVAGGYWRYTLERLFALKEIQNHFPENSQVLHFEADVLSFLNDELLRIVHKSYTKTAVPRYSKEDGIASILYSPSITQLVADLENLDRILWSNPLVQSDMELLGIALNENALQELPTYPQNGIVIEETLNCRKILVFDGAAYGQYLFGRDPVHSQGRALSGYQNPNFNIPLNSLDWKLSSMHSFFEPYFEKHKDAFFFGNLHIHAKLPVQDFGNADWVRVIAEAREETDRLLRPHVVDVIHSRKSSLTDRLRIALRRGLFKAFKRRITQLRDNRT